jgi:glycosyltransferase involved in cell wall biosynthesis
MQTESPKVSVIVPVYNTALLLPKCIVSLISQTLENIEIILVNDASTDNSLEVMRRYEANYSTGFGLLTPK